MQKTVARPVKKTIEQFREENEQIFNQKPIKKSKYTSIAKLDALLVKGNGKEPVIKIVSGKGAEIISFKTALEKYKQEIEQILAKEEKPKDQFEAFINSNFETPFLIVLGEKAHKQAIEIEMNFENNSATKIFVILSEGIEATLAEKIKTSGNALIGETILVKDSAKLSHVHINDLDENTIIYRQAILERDSSIESADFWSKGKLVRGKLTNVLEGRGSSAKQFEIVLSEKKDHFDLNYTAVHRGEDTFSNCLYKAALKDESRNVFDGMILIEKTGSKTNAFLQCNSMILGDKASSNQIPSLEIKTDDVKATHSASVARIEQEEI